jgi:hypothetical protein
LIRYQQNTIFNNYEDILSKKVTFNISAISCDEIRLVETDIQNTIKEIENHNFDPFVKKTTTTYKTTDTTSIIEYDKLKYASISDLPLTLDKKEYR